LVDLRDLDDWVMATPVDHGQPRAIVWMKPDSNLIWRMRVFGRSRSSAFDS
jgi:hypothetical protein